jgi:hypothetical protein
MTWPDLIGVAALLLLDTGCGRLGSGSVQVAGHVDQRRTALINKGLQSVSTV